MLRNTPALAAHHPPAGKSDLILRWNEISTNTTTVDIVVHLHGYSGELANMELAHKLSISGLDFAGDPDAAAGTTTGRTRPTLGVLPRGLHSPSTDRADRYTSPALTSIAGMQALIDYALAQFGQHNAISNPRRGRLIFTAHSGGGAPLLALLDQINAHPDSGLDPDEIHTFDALYGPADANHPVSLIGWATRRIRRSDGALRVLYLPGDEQHPGTQPRSLSVARALARLVAADPSRGDWYRVEAVGDYPRSRTDSRVPDRHTYMPRFYGWRLLAAANATLPHTHPASVPVARAHALDAPSTAQPGQAVSTPGVCTVTGDAVTCGTCTAREHRVRAGSPVSLAAVPGTLLLNRNRGEELDPAAIQALTQMVHAARADGIDGPLLLVVSGHRDYDRQARLWRAKLLDVPSHKGCTAVELTCAGQAIDATSAALRGQPMPHARDAWQSRFQTELGHVACHLSCEVGGAIGEARMGVAPPGASAHHTGRAIDLFVGTAPNQRSSTTTAPDAVRWQRSQRAYQWLVCNAARFHFYPYNVEPWHWEYNPAVQTAQGFDAGWMTIAFDAPPDNADLRREAQAQWDSHPRVHGHFDNSFERYLELEPLYLAQGIRNPAEYVATHITNVTFFGHNTIAHRDFIAPLRRAEDALRARGVTPALHSFWSFNARPIRGTSATLSKHAVGRAVDINPEENPRIVNRDDILVIEAVTGVNLGQRQQIDVMRQASHKFQHAFTQAWVDQQTTPALVRAIQHRRAELNHYAQHGLLTLEQPLIDELKAAGLHWGGDWPNQKDFMHFELPGW